MTYRNGTASNMYSMLNEYKPNRMQMENSGDLYVKTNKNTLARPKKQTKVNTRNPVQGGNAYRNLRMRSAGY